MGDSFTIQASVAGLEKSIISQYNDAQRVIQSRPLSLKFPNNLPLGRFSKDAKDFSNSLDVATNRVVAFGAAAGALYIIKRGLTDLVQSTIQVNEAFTRINVNLKLSDSQLKSFGASAFDIARQTGKSFEDVAKAAEHLSRQGLTVAETQKRLRDAFILSRDAGLSSEEAIAALTTSVNTFSKQGLTSTDIINKFAAVSSRFAVSSKDLSEAIEKVGETAQSSGIKFDQLVGFVTSAQQITQRGGNAIGTALATILSRVQNPEVIKQLGDLGIAVKDVGGNTLPVIQILQNLAGGYDKLSTYNRHFIDEQVAGARQINILKAALSDISNQYGTYNQAINTSANATDEAIRRNEQYNTSLKALLSQTGTSIKETLSSLGNISISPILEPVLKGLNSGLKSLNSQSGSGAGETIGQGILKGIASVIEGPGLATLGLFLVKSFFEVSKTISKQAIGIIGLNQGQEQRVQIENRINQLLAQGTSEELAQFRAAENVLQAKEAILAVQNRINVLNLAQRGAVTQIAQEFELTGSSLKRGAGKIPNLADNSYYRGVGGYGGDNFVRELLTKGNVSSRGYGNIYVSPNKALAQEYAVGHATSLLNPKTNNRGFLLNISTNRAKNISGHSFSEKILEGGLSSGEVSTIQRIRTKPNLETFESEASLGKSLNFNRFQKLYKALFPNFAGPLSDAVEREKAAGVPPSAIYIDKDSRLRSPENPFGLMVANRLDEPFSGSQGVDRVLRQGGNPKTAGITPNFADDGPFSGLRNTSGQFIKKADIDNINSLFKSLSNLKGDELYKVSASIQDFAFTLNKTGEKLVSGKLAQKINDRFISSKIVKSGRLSEEEKREYGLTADQNNNYSPLRAQLIREGDKHAQQFFRNEGDNAPFSRGLSKSEIAVYTEAATDKAFQRVLSGVEPSKLENGLITKRLTNQSIQTAAGQLGPQASNVEVNTLARKIYKDLTAELDTQALQNSQVKNFRTYDSKLSDRTSVFNLNPFRNGAKEAERIIEKEGLVGPAAGALRQRGAEITDRRNNRLQLASIGASFAGGFISEGAGGTTSGQVRGGIRGALQGAGIGGIFGPEGLAIGAALGALIGVFQKAKESVEEFATRINESNAKEKQKIDTISSAVDALSKVNEIKNDTSISPQDRARINRNATEAINAVPDSAARNFIIKNAGNIDTLNDNLEKLISQSNKNSFVGNTLTTLKGFDFGANFGNKDNAQNFSNLINTTTSGLSDTERQGILKSGNIENITKAFGAVSNSKPDYKIIGGVTTDINSLEEDRLNKNFDKSASPLVDALDKAIPGFEKLYAGIDSTEAKFSLLNAILTNLSSSSSAAAKAVNELGRGFSTINLGAFRNVGTDAFSKFGAASNPLNLRGLGSAEKLNLKNESFLNVISEFEKITGKPINQLPGLGGGDDILKQKDLALAQQSKRGFLEAESSFIGGRFPQISKRSYTDKNGLGVESAINRIISNLGATNPNNAQLQTFVKLNKYFSDQQNNNFAPGTNRNLGAGQSLGGIEIGTGVEASAGSKLAGGRASIYRGGNKTNLYKTEDQLSPNQSQAVLSVGEDVKNLFNGIAAIKNQASKIAFEILLKPEDMGIITKDAFEKIVGNLQDELQKITARLSTTENKVASISGKPNPPKSINSSPTKSAINNLNPVPAK